MNEKEVPLHIDASLDLSEGLDACLIEISSSDGQPLTPQTILDACADMLMAKFAMIENEWEVQDEDLNS